MKKYNKIITKELKRILPYHLLGVILHTIVIYMAFKIPNSIGNILDMLMQTNIDKEQIMKEAYWLIFYCSFVFIPRTLYRTLYFTVSRKSDTYLRKKEGNISRTNIRARVVKTRKGIKKLYIQTQ